MLQMATDHIANKNATHTVLHSFECMETSAHLLRACNRLSALRRPHLRSCNDGIQVRMMFIKLDIQ